MKPLSMPVLIAAGVAIAIPAVWLASNSRAAVETPRFTIIRKSGSFELRDYPRLIVAQTPMTEGGMNGSFGKLFRYITGKNAASGKIPMTAPVLIDGDSGHRTMSFVMPNTVAEEGVPAPTEADVKVVTRVPGRYAVMRFRGPRTTFNEQRALAKLRGWMQEHRITPSGDPVFAYYDPPWTPPFLRRNEVLVAAET